jgi:hypothetical protein
MFYFKESLLSRRDVHLLQVTISSEYHSRTPHIMHNLRTSFHDIVDAWCILQFNFSVFHSVYHFYFTLPRSQPNSTKCLWHPMLNNRFGTSSARLSRNFPRIASKPSLSMWLFDRNLLHHFCICCSPAPFSIRSVGLTIGLSFSHRQPYPHSCLRSATKSGVRTE